MGSAWLWRRGPGLQPTNRQLKGRIFPLSGHLRLFVGILVLRSRRIFFAPHRAEKAFAPSGLFLVPIPLRFYLYLCSHGCFDYLG